MKRTRKLYRVTVTYPNGASAVHVVEAFDYREAEKLVKRTDTGRGAISIVARLVTEANK